MNAVMELSKDRRMAALVSVSIATVAFVILHFLSYQIPMPPLPEALKYKDMEVEFVELEAASLPETANAGGGGGGDEVNAPKSDKFEEQMQEILTNNGSNMHVSSGKSNHTNTNKPTNNSPSTKNPDPNPFDNDGGSGSGKGGGNGGGLGSDDGNGKGDGPSGNGSGNVTRYLVAKPNTSSIDADEDCKIVFTVQIAADGSIVGTPKVDRSATTTDNSSLISKVASLVKSQARYNSAKGASVVTKKLTVDVRAR